MKESSRERLVAIAPKLGYPLFYLASLVVFASWTFPFDKIKDRISSGFNADQRAAGSLRELSVEGLSSSWLTGLKLTGVHLTEPSADPAKPPDDMKIDSVLVRVSLLPLLVGNHNLTFHVAAFAGTIDGSWTEHGKDVALEATLDNLDASQITAIAEFLGVPVEGSLSGTISMELPEAKVVDPKGGVSFKVGKANGTLAIEARDLAMGDGKAKVRGTLAIPKLTVGGLTINAEVKDGTAKITKLAATGRDVDFVGDGRVILREPMAESNGDFNIRFKINDAYRAKNETTKSLFGAPGSTIPAAIDLDPRMKQSKRADGFYTWRGHGPLSKLDFSPGGTGGPAGPTVPSASAGGGATSHGSP